MDFVLSQWIDGNSIKLENMGIRMGLGGKNVLDISFGHTVFEVSREYWVIMDFSLKEKIWNERFRFRSHQHPGNVEIMWTDEIIDGDFAD